jgi:hypothetical protein
MSRFEVMRDQHFWVISLLMASTLFGGVYGQAESGNIDMTILNFKVI